MKSGTITSGQRPFELRGGADEVLRNQISERVLGMPGEMRADKDVPFDQLK